MLTAEQQRLNDTRQEKFAWKKWGPYLSERQWGTVREDYSEGGDAWSYFTHDQARSRAYRWGEDGIAGVPRETIERFPRLRARAREDYERYADLLGGAANPMVPGVEGRHLLSVLDESKLRRVLSRMLDEERFLGPHGIRSLSRSHLDEPFVFTVHGQEYRVQYLPAESDTAMFGGNSNWRGPIWMPVNALLIRALLQYYMYYGNGFIVECPTGSGRQMTLYQIAQELARRLANIFLLDQDGRRPVYGRTKKFQEDP